ncbi:energy transducer TonB [Silvibacterium dinghuense]|uniref:Energy transducer TonB n=1 Tax=Silvibacterium dinghuense TaxID=1560006 RepID=A0A4Q1S8Y5_9BACT|nr:energy transducer TonB [Silvibacterium dinghuense]RXS93454.1 energy transducer TonB [Silvibacterium dinghuense]GGH05973.1 hypothetical protein GCM10011586_22720 [Silvibacterium dinghuense]
MFADSLVESTGRLHTSRRSLALVSLLVQGAILAALAMWPLIHPDRLPPRALTMLITAPLPPSSPPQAPHAAAISRAVPALLNALTAPTHIHPITSDSSAPNDTPIVEGATIGDGSGDTRNLAQLFNDGPGSKPPDVTLAKPAHPSGPVRISEGVALGHLLNPIQPVYPAIAKAARISGTVVVEATISTNGTVIHAHAVSGPPMLVGAAVDAVSRARYQPYQLSGQPVEVQTTVSVVFRLE